MTILENALYIEDLEWLSRLQIPWDKLREKTIMISGSTGLIGSCFIDTIMAKNFNDGLNCRIVALGRNKDRFNNRFEKWKESDKLEYFQQDVNMPIAYNSDHVDFILHLASNTHPLQYSQFPIETISSNIIGTYNILHYAAECHATRVAFASSNEIYGENRGDQEWFDESYCGYIDCNTLRAGYPESKRCGEALCQAFISQKGLDVVIPRFTRSYGPTMLLSDSKAISQFIKNALNRENIILKSKGTQYYSYTYVADAVSGLLYVLLLGEKGNAYNISDEKSDIMLKDLAGIIAGCVGKKVIFQLPDSVEAMGYSKATKARINGAKLKKLGWEAKYTLKSGISRTIQVLDSMDR